MGSLVTITTDFGLEDAYAAALEAAVLRVGPELRVSHVSHMVPPGDVATGAYLLEYATASFPEGTVHLAVVDPEVGTERRMLAVAADGFFVVGPDNGVLDRALRGRTTTAVRLRPESDVRSRTFESRDVMGPAAARLALGEPLETLGQAAVFDSLDPPAKAAVDELLRPGVAHVDGYGSLVLDLVVALDARFSHLVLEGRWIRFGRTFADAKPGELIAYRGSIGYLEVAVRDGLAAQVLGLTTGDLVTLELHAD